MRQSSDSTSGIRRSKRNALSNWRWGILHRGSKDHTITGRVQAVPQPPGGPPTTVPSERASRDSAPCGGRPSQCPRKRAAYNSAPCGGIPNRAPLQGGILKPPALRVVVDFYVSFAARVAT